MLQVPMQPLPSQIISTTLGNQGVQLNIYQRLTGLYIDVYVDNALIIGGVICENLNRIVRSLYLGFAGDLMFIDNQGSNDPYYTGLGDRYSLIYISTTELPRGVG